ncbi:MAG: glycosyltransferase family 4 protein [Bacteroidales bacterium]
MKKKILIISPTPILPIDSGNRACIYSYIEMLTALDYDVYYLWVKSTYNKQIDDESLMKNYWKDKLFIFNKYKPHQVVEFLYRKFRFNTKGNFHIDDIYPFGLNGYIEKIKKDHKFSSVIVNYVFLSKALNRFKESKKLLYTHDVFTNKYRHTGLKWFSVDAVNESKALERADEILAIQENEAIFYSYLVKKKIRTTYSFFPVTETDYVENKNLLILSGSNQHNIDGIDFLIEKVFPELNKIDSEIKIIIGGGICSYLEKKKIENTNISLYGRVDELSDFYKLGNICINPVFDGTGLKIKSFEALSFGKVLISHPHNTLGIYNKERAPILIAMSATEYINQILRVISDKKLILEFKQKSYAYIHELNDVVKQNFVEAIES